MRSPPGFRRPPADASEKRRRFKSAFAEHGCKQGVVLEAVAAALLVDEFSLDVSERNADAAARLNRKVFEQKRLAMQRVQAAKRLDARVNGARVADPAKVVVQPHGILSIIAAL